MRKLQLFLDLPLIGLLVSFLVLYSNDLFGLYIPVASDLNFLEKTSLFAAFAFAVFACVESFSSLDRAQFETRRYQIEDTRNELEKAYGPLYSMLNKVSVRGGETRKSFWLEFDERKKIDDILATYPFMFSQEINMLWQEKIRKLESILETSALAEGELKLNLDPYVELKRLVEEEYTSKVKKYHELLRK